MLEGMPVEVATCLIMAGSSLVMALVNFGLQQARDRKDAQYRKQQEELEKAREEREQERERRENQRHLMDEALMDGVASALEGIDISLIALQGGHLNGNVENARSRVEASAAQMRKVKNSILSEII